jgi:hypothetical protein
MTQYNDKQKQFVVIKITNGQSVVIYGAVTEFGKNSTLSLYGKSLRVVMAINALSGQDHVLEPSAAKHILMC